jgi:subtilisin-like proprotein convertase family protein
LADATWRGSTTSIIPIQVADDIRIEDINVNLSIAHTWLRDLSIQLVGPDGTTVSLVTRRGGSGDNLIATIDDQATKSVTSISSALTVSGTFRGEQALSSFRGKSAKGLWTLRITDNERGDVGQLLKAELDILPANSASTAKVSMNSGRSTPVPSTSIAVKTSQFVYSVIETSTFKVSDDTVQRERFRRSVDQIFARWL